MISNPPPDQLRDDWLRRLSVLIENVQIWAEAIGWTTRKIEARYLIRSLASTKRRLFCSRRITYVSCLNRLRDRHQVPKAL